MKRRERTRKAALAFLSILVALVAANGLVSWLLPLRTTLFELDDELLFRARPGARRVTMMDPRAGGAWIRVRINGDGLRGAPLAASEGRERLLVLGDSLVLGENVPLAETFVERLARHLESSGGWTPAVVNAGVTGYGPDQSLLALRRDFDKLSPHTVLLVLCATNDFGDLLRNKLFELDPQGRLVPFPFQIDPIAHERFAEAERESRRWALARLWDTARERRAGAPPEGRIDYIAEYLQAARAYYHELRVLRDPRVYSLFEDTYDADVAIFPDWDSARAKVELMAAVLREFAASCAERGVDLRAVVVPSAVDVSPAFDIRVDRERWPSYSERRLADRLATLARDAGIAVLDLSEAFVAAGPDGLFVGAGDFHWNAAGQDLGAKECAQFLLEERRR